MVNSCLLIKRSGRLGARSPRERQRKIGAVGAEADVAPLACSAGNTEEEKRMGTVEERIKNFPPRAR